MYLCASDLLEMAELFIKNMVCNRCIMVVRQALIDIGLEPIALELGLVRIVGEINQDHRNKLAKALQNLEFELLDDAKSKLVDQIKTIVIQKIHHSQSLEMTVNWSQLLSSQLNHEYKYLSSSFSASEGMTVEQYIIRQKIERVKELLSYNEQNLTEISYQLGYSSVQHLSVQFKKIVGQTPSQFRSFQMNKKTRKSLDAI